MWNGTVAVPRDPCVEFYLPGCNVKQHFTGTCCPHLQAPRISRARNQHESMWQAEVSRLLLIQFILQSWRLRGHVLPQHKLTSDGPHSVIYQNLPPSYPSPLSEPLCEPTSDSSLAPVVPTAWSSACSCHTPRKHHFCHGLRPDPSVTVQFLQCTPATTNDISEHLLLSRKIAIQYGCKSVSPVYTLQ